MEIHRELKTYNRREWLTALAIGGAAVLAPSLVRSAHAQQPGFTTEDGVLVPFAFPDGFTPDPRLKFNSKLNSIPVTAASLKAFAGDADVALNQPRDGYNPLLGQLDSQNNESDNAKFMRNVTFDAFTVTVLTGEEVMIPGICHLIGAPGRSVGAFVYNIDEWDFAHDIDTDGGVLVKHGWMGKYRIWDGQNNLDVADWRLVSHISDSLLTGEKRRGQTGQCGNGRTNCNEVLVGSFVHSEWGTEGGYPRYFDRMFRAEIVNEMGSVR